MHTETKRRAGVAAALVFIAIALCIPWLLAHSQTEGERRLAESLAALNHSLPVSEATGNPGGLSRSVRHQRAVRLAADGWYRELLEAYPAFEVDYREVEDKSNGFLQYLNLSEGLRVDPSIGDPSSPLPGDLTDMLRGGDEEWEPEELAAWMANNQTQFRRILEVAELPDRSIRWVDTERYYFLGTRLPAQFAALLLGGARLAHDSGDHATALRHYRATMNLADHFDRVEIPSFLAKTIAVRIRRRALVSFHREILPGLPDDPGLLATWREALQHRDEIATEIPRMLTAEWHLTLRHIILPALLSGQTPVEGGSGLTMKIDDQAAFLKAYSDWVERACADPRAASGVGMPQWPDGLSQEARRALDNLHVDARAWIRGMTALNTLAAMNEALIALRLRQDLPLDPTSGEPFDWNAETRTLSPPPGNGLVEPIALR